MRSVLRRIASPVTRVELCTASIWVAICSVAFAVCTASDFTSESDHRETAARFAGARGLNRRIERKQVCLTCNVPDQINDFAACLRA